VAGAPKPALARVLGYWWQWCAAPFARFGILQPLIEIAYTATCDQSTEPLQQFVSNGESLVAFENVLR
jgi:hypothetical protein